MTNANLKPATRQYLADPGEALGWERSAWNISQMNPQTLGTISARAHCLRQAAEAAR